MSERRARFLFVTSSYPFHTDDVHALFVHDMARHLVQRGADVHVLTPWVPEQRHAQERWDGVTVERVRYPLGDALPLTGGAGMPMNVRAAPQRALAAPGLVAALTAATLRAHARLVPDAVIAHWLVPSGLAALAVRAPTLCIAHSSEVHLLARLPGARALAALLRARMRLVSTSEFLRARMQALGLVDDCAIAPLGVRQPSSAGPSSALPAPTPRRICVMTRMVERKGLLELVDALARLPHVHATLAGEGPLQDAVRARVRAHGLDARVVVRGFVKDHEKQAFFAAHHLFAFVPDTPRATDFQDNLPVVCLEALAHGVPVVCTRVGGLPELVERGAGRVVDGPDALVRALDVDEPTLAQWRARALEVGATLTWDRCFAVLAGELVRAPRATGDGARRAARALL